MRALLTTAAAALALGVLAGCGDASTPAASDQTTTTTSSEQPSKTAPEPPTPSDVATPQPPEAGKPQDPVSGEPPVTIGADGPVVPAGVTEVPAGQVDATALPQYVEFGNKVWQYNDGFSLQLFASASSGCSGAEAMVVDQSADAVKIVVRPLDQPQGGSPDGTMCTQVMTPVPVTVTLEQPLRDREVLLSAGR
ncbi:hypothetical protein [Actinophytocola algeriensis]|uniref:Uncharacterized protein n=1 Tax=Actinophytocola algeriensis TaxID=1768010 RepID=A0A7W7VCB5_9PSEU|nr:hypothetical protein [Actinophytocola algeriensis]MBB4904891.1 hypothetical protein [Actinophytocola algeriensis]MBE1476250.1 hypothetical protein [Actinophytocola algeriensis]